MADLDKDMAATLTPEELAAINDAPSDEEQAALAAIAGEGDDDESDEGGGEDDDDQGEGEDDTEGAGQEEGKGAENPGDDGQVAGQEAGQGSDAEPKVAEASRQPRYQAALPEDFNERVAGLDEKEADLWAKFDDGEIERKDLQAGLRDIQRERGELNEAKLRADMYADMNQQNAAAEWNATVQKFVESVAKAEGIDYSKDAEKAAELDSFVRRLAENPAHADKDGAWFLAEGHKRVKALFGIADKPQKRDDPGTAADQPDKLKQTKEARKPPTSGMPKTLAGVPGGDGPGDIASEFANLDNLEGLDLETAIAKMTPDQRQRYMQGA